MQQKNAIKLLDHLTS